MSTEAAIWDYRSRRKLRRAADTAHTHRPSPAEAASRPEGEGGGATPTPPHKPLRGRAANPCGQAALSARDRPPAATASCSAPSRCARAPAAKPISTKGSRPLHAGFCPICQMPFSLLVVETPRWHVAECLDTPGCTDNECPDGLLCSNTIPRHYKRYSHLLLAENRALGQSDVQSTFVSSSVRDADAVSPDLNNNHQSLQIEESLTNKNQNALLLLKSPAIKATKKSSSKYKSARATRGKTSPSEKVSKVGVSVASPSNRLPRSASPLTTEPGMNMDGLFNEANLNSTIERKSYSEDESTFVLASSTNYRKEISYSPLCSDDEIPDQKRVSFTRKRLFHDQAISYSCKGEDDTFSDFGELKDHVPELVHKSSGFKHTVITDVQAISIDSDSSLLTNSANILTRNSNGTATQPQQAKVILSPHDLIPFDNRKQVINWSQPNLTGPNLIKLEPVHSSSDSLLEPLQIKQKPSNLVQFTQSAVVQDRYNYQTRTDARDYSSCPWKTALFDAQCSSVLPPLNTVKQGSSYSKTPIFSQSVGVPMSRTKTLEMTLPGLLERGPIKIPKRSVVNKELKQSDIGVFFGLQPKIKEEKECPKNTPQEKAKELILAVPCNEKRQRQRKRKVGSSVGDEACIGTVDQPQTAPSDGQQRTKRQRGGVSTYKKNKQCPFYKKIPGTNFTVDAFQYGVIEGCTAYFLTHFHSDHYGGLTKNFKCPIYCSTITGNLVISKLKVQAQYITRLPMNSQCVVDGIKVVLLDANHCPGAVMLLFQLPDGKTLLHTGDFRANTSMERYSHLMGQKIHTLYLDTTYCSPEYTFPSQQEAIQFAANIAFETLTMNPRTLVVCGTYSIGKEKVFLAIAEVLGCKVCIARNKFDILQCLDSEHINSVITMDWENSQLHLLPMMQITFKGLQLHMSKFPGKYDKVLAFKPTGWTYSGHSGTVLHIKPRVQGKFTIYGIPYSEHSSYLEMKRFVQWLKPDKIIPTVNNGSWQERNMMDKTFNEWMI